MATQWNLNVRFMQNDDKLVRSRATLDYRITPRFTLGIETNGLGVEWLPRATWFATPPRGDLPSVAFGFTADRLSTPKGEAVFVTFARPLGGGRVNPFASVKWATENDGIYFPFGVNVVIPSGPTVQAIYDGDYTHLIVTQPLRGFALSFVLGQMKHPGIAATVGF